MIFSLFGTGKKANQEPVTKMAPQEIEAMFASGTNVLSFDGGKFVESYKFGARGAYVQAFAGPATVGNAGRRGFVEAGMSSFYAKRMVMELSDLEKGIWKAAAYLHAEGRIDDQLMSDAHASVVFNGGDCVFEVPEERREAREHAYYQLARKAAMAFINDRVPEPREVVMRVVQAAEAAVQSDHHPVLQDAYRLMKA